MAEAKKKECVNYSFEHTDQKVVLVYETQWSN